MENKHLEERVVIYHFFYETNFERLSFPNKRVLFQLGLHHCLCPPKTFKMRYSSTILIHNYKIFRLPPQKIQIDLTVIKSSEEEVLEFHCCAFIKKRNIFKYPDFLNTKYILFMHLYPSTYTTLTHYIFEYLP